MSILHADAIFISASIASFMIRMRTVSAMSRYGNSSRIRKKQIIAIFFVFRRRKQPGPRERMKHSVSWRISLKDKVVIQQSLS